MCLILRSRFSLIDCCAEREHSVQTWLDVRGPTKTNSKKNPKRLIWDKKTRFGKLNSLLRWKKWAITKKASCDKAGVGKRVTKEPLKLRPHRARLHTFKQPLPMKRPSKRAYISDFQVLKSVFGLYAPNVHPLNLRWKWNQVKPLTNQGLGFCCDVRMASFFLVYGTGLVRFAPLHLLATSFFQFLWSSDRPVWTRYAERAFKRGGLARSWTRVTRPGST